MGNFGKKAEQEDKMYRRAIGIFCLLPGAAVCYSRNVRSLGSLPPRGDAKPCQIQAGAPRLEAKKAREVSGSQRTGLFSKRWIMKYAKVISLLAALLCAKPACADEQVKTVLKNAVSSLAAFTDYGTFEKFYDTVTREKNMADYEFCEYSITAFTQYLEEALNALGYLRDQGMVSKENSGKAMVEILGFYAECVANQVKLMKTKLGS
jgi:hypothetical protein